ncbi:MAG: hypothetical protein GF335_02725 [Candidatus Moranbacteria bacterium]|nr:hypothetical protein [Candidatus Moranbacteria bacterium]
MPPSLTTIGSATRDTFIVSKDITIIENKGDVTKQKLLAFEFGAKLTSEYFKSHVGGTAVNVSIGLSRQGIQTEVCSVIGNDNGGRNILKVLENEKVNTDLINVNNKKRTDCSLVMIDFKTRERTIFVHKDAGEDVEQDYSKINTDCIYVSSMKFKWRQKLKEVKDLVQETDKRLFFTPGILQVRAGVEKMKNFLKAVEVIFLNEDECLEFVLPPKRQKTLTKVSKSDIKQLAQKIASFGPKIVAITAGEKGAYILNDKEFLYFPSFSQKKKDITGAGDAFASGFLAQYLKGGSLKQSGKNAVENAASVISKIGTTDGLIKK